MNSFDPLFGSADETPVPGSFAAAPWLDSDSKPTGFAPWGKFSTLPENKDVSLSQTDSQHSALARAREEGEAAGRAAAYAEITEAQKAQGALALSIQQLEQTMRDALAIRLQEAVGALCETIFGPIAIDPERLAKRCALAAEQLDGDFRKGRFRLHPDDIALLGESGSDESILHADPDLERGTVILETAEGEIHDGPAEWRERLREALGLC